MRCLYSRLDLVILFALSKHEEETHGVHHRIGAAGDARVPAAGGVRPAGQRLRHGRLPALCAEAERDFEGFWARHAREELLWHKPFTQTLDESKAPFFKWFHDGELNASYNCLDRHLKTPAGQDRDHLRGRRRQGHADHLQGAATDEVCRFANGLKALGIKKGDRVLIYMPMSIQAVVAMQACARIGATHSVVFGGFSAKSMQERIIDAGAVAVITADGQFRGGKRDPAEARGRRGARRWAAATAIKQRDRLQAHRQRRCR